MTEYRAEIWNAGEWHAVSLSAGELLEPLGQGIARLTKDQTDPPLELLYLLESRVENIDVFGPSVSSPKALQQVIDTVFRGNLRQTTADGHALSWIAGRDHLQTEAETLLSGCEVRSSNLFEQFRSVAFKRAVSATHIVQAGRALSIEEQRAAGVVPKPIGMAWIAGDATKYVRVGSEWQRFHEQVEALNAGCANTLSKAMSDARIICSEDAEKGDRLIHPKQVVPFSEHPGKGGMHYLFTRDLPSDWFRTTSTLTLRRKQAKAWIERAGKEIASRDKRATKAQFLEAAMKKFDLTEHAAKKVWRNADFPGKSQSGAIPEGKKISLSEIMEIE